MNPDKNMDISQHTYETRSHVSGSRYSVHSSTSSASSAGLRARAKAEAARAAHSYVEKEADLIRQKAELEAHMHVLQIQKAAVSASAEAAVYETVFGMEGDQLHNVPKISTHDPVQRTQEYVQNHTLDQVKTEYPTIEPISNTAPQFPNSAYQQFVSDTPPPAVLPAKFENVPAPKMATGRAHSARKLKPWLVEQIESGKYPGLMWDDDQKTCFRIPWKHAGKQDFRHDEDAAIFKAWAQYKNKYQNGDKLDAATWKTRLRCALNKSPEFQERPERSQLDISEPYKVYRIVPPEEQENPKSGKIAHKRKTPSDSKAKSCSEVDLGEKEPKHVILTLSCIETLEATSCASADSGNGSDTSNNDTPAINQHMSTCDLPQPELLNTTLTILQPPFSHVSHKEMQVTVLYSGVEVSNTVIQSGECKLSAKVPFQNSMGKMEHVLLPLPTEPLDKETQIKTEKLLTFLQAGVMLASNMDGIFAQRQKSCSGRVYWTGPCTNSQVTINKLERDKHVKLFDTQKFLTELELYKMKGGNPPEYQVTLCFGEELSDSDPTEDKLITAKIEQVLAAELVHQATEYLRAADVQEPVKEDSSSPFLITLMPVNTSDSMDI